MNEKQMELISALSECQNGIGFAQGVLMSIRTQAAQDASDMLGGISEWLNTTVENLIQKAGERDGKV